MKKIQILGILILVLASNSFKPADEIKWLGFNEGYNLALKKKKMMLIDVYTDWCGWCKRMDRDTYAKSEITELVNKDFIAIKFNPEAAGEYTYIGKKYNGGELAEMIGESKISGYPATIFSNPKTNKRKIIIGYRNAEM
ncbi:MAG: DUF255 domain-containing protein, partial [Bacteroidota bacterium]